MTSIVDTWTAGGVIEKFTGDLLKWNVWKMSFRALLVEEDLLDFLLSTEKRPAASNAPARKAWDRNNARVFAKLVFYTGGRASPVLLPFDKNLDGKGAWRALLKKYEERDDSMTWKLYNDFWTSSLGEWEDTEDFFVRLEEYQRLLKLSDSDLMEATLRHCHPSYTKLKEVLQPPNEKVDYARFKGLFAEYQSDRVQEREQAWREKERARVVALDPSQQSTRAGHGRNDLPDKRKEEKKKEERYQALTNAAQVQGGAKAVHCQGSGKGGHTRGAAPQTGGAGQASGRGKGGRKGGKEGHKHGDGRSSRLPDEEELWREDAVAQQVLLQAYVHNKYGMGDY
jgi:ribosomal protein L12E/L44/L45/RPP1/RPP2